LKTEWTHEEKPVVLFEIPRASHAPVRFGSEEFIRVGSLKKKLKDYPTKEAELWASFSKNPFEHGIAKADLPGDELLSLLDFAGCFDLLGIPLPTDQRGSVSRLAEENLVVRTPGGRFDISNLGAILFAKNLNQFERLSRKALRTDRAGVWRSATPPPPTHKSCKLGEFDNTCHCPS
jgi:ATP-dependent DNA helicase RecG